MYEEVTAVIYVGKGAKVVLNQDLRQDYTEFKVADGKNLKSNYSGFLEKPINRITEKDIRSVALQGYKNAKQTNGYNLSGYSLLAIKRSKLEITYISMSKNNYSLSIHFSKRVNHATVAHKGLILLEKIEKRFRSNEPRSLARLPISPNRIWSVLRKLVKQYLRSELKKL